jgi:hypothetical protein
MGNFKSLESCLGPLPQFSWVGDSTQPDCKTGTAVWSYFHNGKTVKVVVPLESFAQAHALSGLVTYAVNAGIAEGKKYAKLRVQHLADTLSDDV